MKCPMVLYVAATYIKHVINTGHYVPPWSNIIEEWGFDPRPMHLLFLFCFVFCLRNIYYHIRVLKASPFNAISNLFVCLH